MSTDIEIEGAVRTALREAAGQVAVDLSVTAVDLAATPSRAKRRPVALVAVAAVAVVLVAVIIGMSLDDNGTSKHHPVRPATTAPNEVPAAHIPASSADLTIEMNLDASDSDISAVHNLVAGSSDVLQFATVSQTDALDEFKLRYSSCNQNLDSAQPTDFPVSFRLIVDTSPLRVLAQTALLSSQTGVAKVESRSDEAAQGAVNCSEQIVTPAQDAVRKMAVADNIPVVDHNGEVRGTFKKSDMYDESGSVKKAVMLVPVYNTAGTIVGYYGNVSGFLEKNIVEQPGFDLLTYVWEHDLLPPNFDPNAATSSR